MEQCNEEKIKAIFVLFFKDVNPDAIDSLYSKYSPYEPQTSIACCYMKCVVAISCWDEGGIKEAHRYVKNTYRMLLKLQAEYANFGSPVEKILLKVLTAEALMLMAVMKISIKRCVKHYVKAGLNLRSAWRIFNSTQVKIVELCEHAGINNSKIDTTAAADETEEEEEGVPEKEDDVMGDDFLAEFDMVEDIHSFFNSGDFCLPAVNDIKQLKIIAQFGYGLFHLILSLIPSNVLRIVNMLGFEGNRYLGLSSLKNVCNHTQNYRSILGSVVLLWYNLTLKPAFFSDPSYIASGMKQGESTLENLGSEFHGTWLQLFFLGRVAKLQSRYDEALGLFQNSAAQSAHLKECKLLAYYETGWCHMIMWNWSNAADLFFDLMEEARWSKGFYGYLAAVCFGASGSNSSRCRAILREVPTRIKKTVNIELDSYCSRKSEFLFTSTSLEYECKIAALESLYVWRCLDLSEEQALSIIDTVTRRPGDLKPATLASSYLLSGIAWNALSSPSRARQAFDISSIVQQLDARDDYITVCNLCELAQLHTSLGNAEESRRTALRALQYKGYDLESRLYDRVSSVQVKEEK